MQVCQACVGVHDKSLIERNMRPMLFYLIAVIHQKLRVEWIGIGSDLFDVRNCVKQSGIVSPLLFCR